MKVSCLLESHLLSLELSDASAAWVWSTEGTPATTSSATATTATASATAATESTTSSTASSTVTTVTEASVLWARRREISADKTALDVSTGHTLDSGSSLLDGAELNITEALALSSLLVGWNADVLDVTETLESGGKSVLISLESKVGNENGIRWLGALVSILGAALSGVWSWRARSRKVDVQVATVELSTVAGLKGLLSLLMGVELNVTESRNIIST
jgi:hypothetical protein